MSSAVPSRNAKVLIYSHSFAPNVGGVESYVMLLAGGLASKSGTSRDDVLVISPTAKRDFDDASLPFAVMRKPSLTRLTRAIRGADIVHLAGPVLLPLLIAILLRRRITIEQHGYQASCPNGLLFHEPDKVACPDRYMQREYLECIRCNASVVGTPRSVWMLGLTFVRRWLCSFADANLAISNHLAARLRLPRTTVIYYGVPSLPHQAKPADISSESNELPPALRVAFVGRLVREKDVGTLIQAVQLAAQAGYQVELTVIGDGPERAALQGMAHTNSGQQRILFTGYLTGQQLAAALESVHVVVIPTIMEETAGLAVMEQFMRGRTVVVSNIGGLAEMAGEAGLKFPPQDPLALSNCLRRLMDEPDLLRELGKKARKRAEEKFTLDRMIEEHTRTYREILAQ